MQSPAVHVLVGATGPSATSSTTNTAADAPPSGVQLSSRSLVTASAANGTGEAAPGSTAAEEESGEASPGSPSSTSSPSPQEVFVPRHWQGQPGDNIPGLPGFHLGPCFGSGTLSMNSIYRVLAVDGSGSGYALKLCKQRTAARNSLAHEWKMFKDLKLLGEQQPLAKTRFLQADKVLLEEGSRLIRGILMEEATGSTVLSRLKAPGFANVRYVLALLQQVLQGLALAQEELGFAHYDLKLDNVMEHWDLPRDKMPTNEDPLLLVGGRGAPLPTFKIFDFGTAVVYPDPYSMQAPRPGGAPAKAAGQLRQRAAAGTGKPGVVPLASDPQLYDYSEPFCMVRLYHCWGWRGGDVYRVLCALGRHLDGRSWPVEDIELVSLLLTALEHSTARKRLTARFLPREKLLGPERAPQWRTAITAARQQALQQQQEAAAAPSSTSGESSAAAVVPSGVTGVVLARLPQHRSLDAGGLSRAGGYGNTTFVLQHTGGSAGGVQHTSGVLQLAGNSGPLPHISGGNILQYAGGSGPLQLTNSGNILQYAGSSGILQPMGSGGLLQLVVSGSSLQELSMGGQQRPGMRRSRSFTSVSEPSVSEASNILLSGAGGAREGAADSVVSFASSAMLPAPQHQQRQQHLQQQAPNSGRALGAPSRRLLEPYSEAMAAAKEASTAAAAAAPAPPPPAPQPGGPAPASQQLEGASSTNPLGPGVEVAPLEEQSVMGQLGSVKGVTARQLLQEPLMQLLFAKLKEQPVAS